MGYSAERNNLPWRQGPLHHVWFYRGGKSPVGNAAYFPVPMVHDVTIADPRGHEQLHYIKKGSDPYIHYIADSYLANNPDAVEREDLLNILTYLFDGIEEANKHGKSRFASLGLGESRELTVASVEVYTKEQFREAYDAWAREYLHPARDAHIRFGSRGQLAVGSVFTGKGVFFHLDNVTKQYKDAQKAALGMSGVYQEIKKMEAVKSLAEHEAAHWQCNGRELSTDAARFIVPLIINSLARQVREAEKFNNKESAQTALELRRVIETQAESGAFKIYVEGGRIRMTDELGRGLYYPGHDQDERLTKIETAERTKVKDGSITGSAINWPDILGGVVSAWKIYREFFGDTQKALAAFYDGRFYDPFFAEGAPARGNIDVLRRLLSL